MLNSTRTTTFATVLTSDVQLTAREALSGISASISLSSWIFFLIPQILENRRNQSGEAISPSFMFIRFLSDICNLIGGSLAGILPGMIAVAVDYCISDVLLISQVYYYSIKNRRKEGKTPLTATIETLQGNLEPFDDTSVAASEDLSLQHEEGDTSPLLRQHSHQKHYGVLSDPVDQLTDLLDERGSRSIMRVWLKDLGFLFGVCFIATVGWMLAYQFGIWTPEPEESEASINTDKDVVNKSAQVLGYLSAALSLCCRIPQILKNWRKKNCEGLSLLFFVFSLVGNLAYGASILFHSTEKDYLIKNTPWLVGSLGTMAQDILIFFQLHWYQGFSK